MPPRRLLASKSIPVEPFELNGVTVTAIAATYAGTKVIGPDGMYTLLHLAPSKTIREYFRNRVVPMPSGGHAASDDVCLLRKVDGTYVVAYRTEVDDQARNAMYEEEV